MSNLIIDVSEKVKSNSYSMTYYDISYNIMSQYLYDNGITSDLLTKAWIKEQRGKISNCDYKQIYFYQIAIDYILTFLKDKNKKCFSKDDLNELINSYDFKCVRNTIVCRFGNPSIWDGLLLSVGAESVDGLGNMVQEGLGLDCEPAWIIV